MKHLKLISKAAALIVMITCFHASAQTIPGDKTVTADIKDMPIINAVSTILQGTGIGYIADKGVMGNVTLSMTDTPLMKALSALLAKSGTTGRIDGTTFIISPKPKPLNLASPIEDAGNPIRVGLTSSIGKIPLVAISSSGPADVLDASTGKLITVIGNEQVTLAKAPGGVEVIVMGKSYGVTMGPVRVQPASPLNVFAIAAPKVSYTRYTGVLEAIPSPSGTTLYMVNELPLEYYVRGVIPVEVPASFKPEAQKALVLAIRTYAVRSTKRHEITGFSLCDSVDCQGFSGSGRESAWVDALLSQTIGQVITYDNEPIYSLYSTDCGGATQCNEDAGISSKPWPFLRSIKDSDEAAEFCADSPNHTWTKLLTPADLTKAFARYQTMKLGAFKTMEFTAYDTSGRVKSVKLTFEKGESRITGPRFREIFGMSVIKSTMMTLTANPDGSYLINGKGYGHGIGMCASGANGMAKAHPEYTYRDILNRYYTGIEIKTMRPDGTLTSVAFATTAVMPAPVTPTVKPGVVETPKPIPTGVETPKPVPTVPTPSTAQPVIETPKPPAPVIRQLSPPASEFGPPVLPGRTAASKAK
ncbi:MAG: SpoIID/LytB domain-containing protein [Armatimonadota bacterium]